MGQLNGDSGFNFKGRAKREPNADIRQLASVIHEFYSAMVMEGFSKHQALELTITFLTVTMERGMNEGGD